MSLNGIKQRNALLGHSMIVETMSPMTPDPV